MEVRAAASGRRLADQPGEVKEPVADRYVGRFAPSPSGPLHFGSLVAAVASYSDAKANRGRWLLRIEDLDPPREVAGAAESFPRVLEAFGLQWDGAILRQSTRDAAYRAALDQLRTGSRIFPCGCTRAQLEHAPLGATGERVYPGTCREGLAPGRDARSWRLRVDAGLVTFVDRIQGPQTQNLLRESGDFVLRRADGFWAYQLAVVVDDWEQGITDIVRGADLLASTPRQIWLQRQLGAPVPRYAHVPAAVNAAGEKLSKQTHAPALSEHGALALLLAAWSFLGQPPPSEEFANADEFWRWAIANWNVRSVPPVTMLHCEAGTTIGL